MKQHLLLDETWRLWSAPHGEGDNPEMPPAGADLLHVTLPEDVHEALRRAGRIRDYNIGDNFVRCQHVNDLDWCFQKDFTVPSDWPKEKTAIILQGIDLFGEVWLNGQKLGKTENAFLPVRFDVTQLLKRDAPNLLTVRIGSLAKKLGRKRYTGAPSDWDGARTLVRKPQFSFGWDWAPNLPATGLDHVRLETHGGYEIADVYVRPRMSGHLDVFVEMNRQIEKDDNGKLVIAIEGHGVSQTKVLMPAWPNEPADGRPEVNGRIQAARFYAGFDVESPMLWWPNGYGEQPLYNYKVSFFQDGRERDTREGRFAFREVKTYEEPFEPNGLTWGIEVNGRKILVRGANWVPSRLFPYLQKEQDYRRILGRAVEAHFNMLRVWGGGIYEREPFYDFCDEHGILVWQDFMFASARYDIHDKAFRSSIIREAEHQLRRLRNRPCIALWCGCNEDRRSWSYRQDILNDSGASLWAGESAERDSLGEDEKELYSMILRGAVSRLTELPYVESSPQSHGDYGNDPLSGNSHHSCHKYCMLRSATEFRDHFRTPNSFNSEFCVQGPARKRTLERFLLAEHRWPPDEVWDRHIMAAHYGLKNHELQKRFASELFGPPDTLEQFCKYGMAVHAEFTRAEFESVRHWRGKSGGTMVWMLNDSWPTSNWSIVDFYNIPKAAFYAAKRACAPTTLVLFPDGRDDSVSLTLCNQSDKELRGAVRWGEMRLNGDAINQFSNELSISPYESRRITAIIPSHDSDIFLWAEADFGNLRIERITYFPHLWKDIRWPDPGVKMAIREQERRESGFITRVAVRAERYARFLHLDVDPLAETVFSDNFFDLVGGDERIIEIQSPRKIGMSDIRIGHWLTEWS